MTPRWSSRRNDDDSARSSTGRRRGVSRHSRLFGWTAIVMTVVVTATVLGLYFTVRAKLDSIGRIVIADTHHRPPSYNNALNVMLLGSDTRSGHNAAIGGRIGCNCSDTIMVAHISPGRHEVTVLSIPRDTVVPLYKCDAVQGTPGQAADPSALERINATLEAGGPECVRTTVEQQTGIRINDVIQLDFTGFQRVINDVGGVNVCVPVAIHDPHKTLANGDVVGSGLSLSAGRHHITGKVALKFWRARYALADGGDVARIERDQYLMAQVAKGVLHSGLLTSPTKLYSVISDIASSMSTDATPSDLVRIATSLSGISTKDVQFVTAPTVPYQPNPNELEFAPHAHAVFAAIAQDQKLPASPKRGHKGKSTLLTTSPAKVKVAVLNGTSISQLASKVAAGLAERGFTIVGQPGNAASPDYVQSVIEYGSLAQHPAIDTLREQLPGASVKQVPGLTPGTLQLILGTSFRSLASQTKPLGSISGSFKANSNCRNGAFFGPNLAKPSGRVGCAC
ncbi:MAG: LCP family protein [Streptosporangiaceae bacterium]